MDDKIGQKLDEELIRIEDKMKSLTPGSKEYAEMANAFRTLHQTRLDGVKAEWDYNDKCERRAYENGRADEDLRVREHDEKLKRDQFEEQRKDRWIRVAIAGVELVVPLAVYGFLYCLGLKFEETGSYTSNTVKKHLNFLNPFRK